MIQFLNQQKEIGFTYKILAERGKNADSPRVWYARIPFLARYTETYRRPVSAGASNLTRNGIASPDPTATFTESPSTQRKGSPEQLSNPPMKTGWLSFRLITSPYRVTRRLVRVTRRLVRKAYRQSFGKLFKKISSAVRSARRGMSLIGQIRTGSAHGVVWKKCRQMLIEHVEKMQAVDVLHIIRPNAVSDQIIEILKAKNPATRIIVGPNLMAYGHPSNGFSFRQFSKLELSCVLAISTYHQHLLADFGFDAGIIRRLPPSVHPQYFHPPQNNDQPITNRPIRLMFAASQLSVEKGIAEFLLCMQQLDSRYPGEYCAVVIGSPEVNESVQTRPPEGLINSVSEQVEFVGPITRQEMNYYYSTLDIFIHCGEPENGPTTMIEALSCGTPCVLTDHICFREPELSNGCFYYPRGNIDGLINCILRAKEFIESHSAKRFLPTVRHEQTLKFLEQVYKEAVN
ncbi:MAG: glycosyltransferase family 4 protein [Gammaproteobacteria bacterium]|nr:glycosyltransferase family 4 protein [Gammaproteobacteria bacterium]